MDRRRKTFSILGIALYFLGILLALLLCGWHGWGAAEATILNEYPPQAKLKSLQCPLMVAATETSSISASFDNPTGETIYPVISTIITRPSYPSLDQVRLTIEPGETKVLTWPIDSGNVTFHWLILAIVFESQQGDYPAHLAQCNIMVSRLPFLSGKAAFITMFASAIGLIIAGAACWLFAASPLRGLKANATRACRTLTVVILLDMVCVPLRWWGPGIFLSMISLLMGGVIITNFVLFPTDTDRAET
jgi:hypothetical protein